MALFIISGPSQAGKTTLANLLLNDKNVTRIITATSRKPRQGEVDKVDFYFLKEEDFKDKSKFIETALVHGNCYGTLKKEVEEKLKLKNTVILVMDVQGVKSIKDNFKEIISKAITIFVLPDKLSILLERIKAKNDPNISERIKSVKIEMSYLYLFDYIISTSKNIEDSLKDIKYLINGNKTKELKESTKNFNVNYFLNN